MKPEKIYESKGRSYKLCRTEKLTTQCSGPLNQFQRKNPKNKNQITMQVEKKKVTIIINNEREKL
jgi:hypothetical protein